MPRGSVLRKRREAMGLRQQDIAPLIPRADDPAKHISDALLSQIESEAIRLPRGFSRQYMWALAVAADLRELGERRA